MLLDNVHEGLKIIQAVGFTPAVYYKISAGARKM